MKLLAGYQNFFVLALLSAPMFAAAEPPAAGVPNFHQVDEYVFRGGQPAGHGWDSLGKLGVKVVVDLRRENEDGEHFIAVEAKAVQAAGMRYVNVPMKGIVAPSDAAIAKVLALLNGTGPVFVHCKEGKDRTGTVIACYRISHDRWENKKAIDEANAIGLHWKDVGMRRYISQFRDVVGQSVRGEKIAPDDQQ